MKELKIVRVEEELSGAIGVLLIDGLAQCFTLQPDSKDEHYHIPTGKYEVKRFHGAKYKDTFEIVVPKHYALLFHPGNTEVDTEGCILLGCTVGWVNGKRAVLSSNKAFSEFMAVMGNDQVASLTIIDI